MNTFFAFCATGLILIFTGSSTANPQQNELPGRDTVIVTSFSDGNTSHASYENGVLHGAFYLIGPLGDTNVIEHYRHGKLHGYAKSFLNGKPVYSMQYENGRRVGTMLIYDSTGHLEVEMIFNKPSLGDEDRSGLEKLYAQQVLFATQKYESGVVTETKIYDQLRYEHYKASLPLPGKTLFQQQCGACHLPGRLLVGPPMQGIFTKRSESWVRAFIRDAEGMKASGDTASLQIAKQFFDQKHPSYNNLNEEQLSQLIAYLKSL